jgi:hypothetical protein
VGGDGFDPRSRKEQDVCSLGAANQINCLQGNPVFGLARIMSYESGGQEFESLRARQSFSKLSTFLKEFAIQELTPAEVVSIGGINHAGKYVALSE